MLFVLGEEGGWNGQMNALRYMKNRYVLFIRIWVFYILCSLLQKEWDGPEECRTPQYRGVEESKKDKLSRERPSWSKPHPLAHHRRNIALSLLRQASQHTHTHTLIQRLKHMGTRHFCGSQYLTCATQPQLPRLLLLSLAHWQIYLGHASHCSYHQLVGNSRLPGALKCLTTSHSALPWELNLPSLCLDITWRNCWLRKTMQIDIICKTQKVEVWPGFSSSKYHLYNTSRSGDNQ